MKKQPEMLDEYDFSKGVRGKYAKAYHEGVNIVKIDEECNQNEALRTLMCLLAKNHEAAQSA